MLELTEAVVETHEEKARFRLILLNRAKWRISVMSAFVLIALISLYAGWRLNLIPYPYSLPRSFVLKRDYQTMEQFFKKPLPSSFQIRKVRYPLPVPDGCEPATYKARVQAKDLENLVHGLRLKKEGEEKGFWLYESRTLFERFGSDLPVQYEQDRNAGKKHWPALYLNESVRLTPSNHFNYERFTIDSRTSPSLTVYIQTQLAYSRRK